MNPCPDLLPLFPHARPLRTYPDGDVMLCEPDLPGAAATRGFLSRHEAAILHAIAQEFPGYWLEIGSHTGWSAAHILAADCRLVAVDPEYSDDSAAPEIYRRAKLAMSNPNTMFWGHASKNYFANPAGIVFSGAHIDGDHTSPGPLNDAKGVLPLLMPRSVVVFHDAISPCIQEGIAFLRGNGFQVHQWMNTPNGVAACWRGDAKIQHDVPWPKS